MKSCRSRTATRAPFWAAFDAFGRDAAVQVRALSLRRGTASSGGFELRAGVVSSTR